jgi:hypothetical protein
LSNSFAFLSYNVAVSSGNLFVERLLFERLGGFRNMRFNHDWDFCLRTGALAEPKLVRKALYTYRLHGANTIDAQRLSKSDELERIIAELFAECRHGSCSNPLAPQWPDNRALLVNEALQNGMGRFVPVEILRSLAEQARAEYPFHK